MGWICPECGFTNAEDVAVCTCGFDHSVFLSADLAEAESNDGEHLVSSHFGVASAAGDVTPAGRSASSSANRAVAEKVRPVRSSFHPPDRITVREVGSWKFSFSPSEEKISIGTDALEPFRLDLAVKDFEEILEKIYEMSGTRKTVRGVELMDKDVLELVEFIVEMIDSKRSKIRPSFSPEDVGIIATIINGKLSQ